MIVILDLTGVWISFGAFREVDLEMEKLIMVKAILRYVEMEIVSVDHYLLEFLIYHCTFPR